MSLKCHNLIPLFHETSLAIAVSINRWVELVHQSRLGLGVASGGRGVVVVIVKGDAGAYTLFGLGPGVAEAASCDLRGPESWCETTTPHLKGDNGAQGFISCERH